MTHAIRIHETGGAEVLRWEAVEVGEPAAGEVRIHQTARLRLRDRHLR